MEAIKKTQDRLLEMAKEVTAIFEKNDIKYFICFGTLIGALRHGGFIPWDDDFDIFLFEEDYDNAIRLLLEELPDDVFVNNRKTNSSYFAAWSCVKDKNSIRYKNGDYDGDSKSTAGINLDLYCLQTVPRELVEVSRKRQNIEYVVYRHNLNRISFSEYEKRFNAWTNDYIRALNQVDLSEIDYNDEVFSSVLSVRLVEKNDILPLKKYKFEDTEFYGPNNPDALLKQTYNEYMEFPPYDERRPHCDAIEFVD